MVKHVVMWTLQKGLDKNKVFEEMNEIFAGFKNEVPGLESLELYKGYDGADIMLVSVHKNAKALEEYQAFPGHLSAKKYVHSVIEQRAFCDYELIE